MPFTTTSIAKPIRISGKTSKILFRTVSTVAQTTRARWRPVYCQRRLRGLSGIGGECQNGRHENSLRPRLLLAAALVATLLAPAIAQGAPSDELKRFITPSRNIGCFGDAKTVRCEIKTTTGKLQRRPANCQLERGDAFELNRTGKGHGLCDGDTALPAPNEKAPVLKYGHTIRLGAS